MNKQETGRGFLLWIVLLAGSVFARAPYALMNRSDDGAKPLPKKA